MKYQIIRLGIPYCRFDSDLPPEQVAEIVGAELTPPNILIVKDKNFSVETVEKNFSNVEFRGGVRLLVKSSDIDKLAIDTLHTAMVDYGKDAIIKYCAYCLGVSESEVEFTPYPEWKFNEDFEVEKIAEWMMDHEIDIQE